MFRYHPRSNLLRKAVSKLERGGEGGGLLEFDACIIIPIDRILLLVFSVFRPRAFAMSNQFVLIHWHTLHRLHRILFKRETKVITKILLKR